MASLAINNLDDCKALGKKPTVIVSACLLGQAVRYDGKAKTQKHLDLLQQYCQVKSICPEAESGLGIPRPPVRLTKTEKGIEAIGVKDNSLNVTQALQKFSADALSSINTQAFILKARSPSCGIQSTPIHNDHGEVIHQGSGIFAEQAQSQYPQALFYDESIFVSCDSLTQVIVQCYRLLRKRLKDQNSY